MTERQVIEERGPRGGLDPAVGVFVALLAAALIGLLIWFFAARDDNDGDGNTPAPTSTSQQQDEPSDEPSEEDSSEPAPSTSP